MIFGVFVDLFLGRGVDFFMFLKNLLMVDVGDVGVLVGKV